jgi:hypothetical protein
MAAFKLTPVFCLNLNGKLQKAKKLDEPVWGLPDNVMLYTATY